MKGRERGLVAMQPWCFSHGGIRFCALDFVAFWPLNGLGVWDALAVLLETCASLYLSMMHVSNLCLSVFALQSSFSNPQLAPCLSIY